MSDSKDKLDDVISELKKLNEALAKPPSPPPPKGLWNEFKAFLGKGGVLALAVGFIMGTYIGKVVSALVFDIIMPIPGALTPGGNWQNATFTVAIGNGMKFAVGDFVANVVNFLIVAVVVFFIVRYATKLGIK
ncbi:MAG: MscL family protein [Conexivisphaerales archaeon]